MNIVFDTVDSCLLQPYHNISKANIHATTLQPAKDSKATQLSADDQSIHCK